MKEPSAGQRIGRTQIHVPLFTSYQYSDYRFTVVMRAVKKVLLAEIIVLMEFQSTRGTDKLCQRVSDILFRRHGEAVYHDQRGQIQCATSARVSVITVFHFEPFSGQK
jgi:hypothetical protein